MYTLSNSTLTSHSAIQHYMVWGTHSDVKCVNQLICEALLYYGGNDIKH